MSGHRTQYWAGPVTLFLLMCQLGFCWKSLAHSLGADVDFRAFYTSGHMVAIGLGEHLYDYDMQRELQNELISHSEQTLPFLYPAFAALLFVPLSLLSYKVAFLLFGLFNLCLLAATGVWTHRYIPLIEKGPAWLPGYLFLSFFPVSIAIMQGQLSVIVLSLYTLSFLFQQKQSYMTSGIFLACALIKFQLAIPVAFLFLCWRQWRTVIGFVLGAVILAAVSIAVTGLHGAVLYTHGLLDITREGLQNAHVARLRYGMFPGDMPNFRGLFFLITHGVWVGQALALLCSAGAMVWSAKQRPSLAVALPAAMMVSYHMQAYDLTLLLLPMSILWNIIGTKRPTSGGHTQQGPSSEKRTAYFALSGGLAILLVPIAPFLLANGLCAFFAISILGTLWVAGSTPLGTEDITNRSSSEITAPQPC